MQKPDCKSELISKLTEFVHEETTRIKHDCTIYDEKREAGLSDSKLVRAGNLVSESVFDMESILNFLDYLEEKIVLEDYAKNNNLVDLNYNLTNMIRYEERFLKVYPLMKDIYRYKLTIKGATEEKMCAIDTLYSLALRCDAESLSLIESSFSDSSISIKAKELYQTWVKILLM